MSMTELAEIAVLSRNIQIFHTSGEVMEARKWTTTEVSGGGGEGVVSGTNGHVSGYSYADPVTSTTTTHDQFFIRCTDGKERVLKLANKDVQARTGNWVTLLLAIPEGKESGAYVAVINHDLDESRVLTDGINATCESKVTLLALLAAAVVTVIGILVLMAHLSDGAPMGGFGWLMVLALLPAFHIWRSRLRGRCSDQVRALCGKVTGPRPAITVMPAEA